MIGILIKYERKKLFTRLPKDSERLKNQLSRIGLNVLLKSIKLSNHNDIGYEVQIFTQDGLDNEIASRIILHDNIGQLNDLITYVSQRDADEMYDRICESSAESIAELYRELTAPPKIENNHGIELQTVKAPVTDAEKRLLDTLSSVADRIATFARLGSRDFSLEDVLKDLDCSFDDVKDMMAHAVAQKVSSLDGISSVEVSELDIPQQPEITVITKEEMEESAAEDEELGGLSF